MHRSSAYFTLVSERASNTVSQAGIYYVTQTSLRLLAVFLPPLYSGTSSSWSSFFFLIFKFFLLLLKTDKLSYFYIVYGMHDTCITPVRMPVHNKWCEHLIYHHFAHRWANQVRPVILALGEWGQEFKVSSEYIAYSRLQETPSQQPLSKTKPNRSSLLLHPPCNILTYVFRLSMHMNAFYLNKDRHAVYIF